MSNPIHRRIAEQERRERQMAQRLYKEYILTATDPVPWASLDELARNAWINVARWVRTQFAHVRDDARDDKAEILETTCGVLRDLEDTIQKALEDLETI